MADIVFTNLGASANPDINNGANASSYANTSWTPPTSGIIVVFVGNHIAANGNVPTISGNGLTWIQIATAVVDPGTSHRITLFAADASGATTGVTTIDFNAETQLDCNASFFQVQNMDISGGVAAAFIQTPSNNGTGTSGSVTLAAAGNSANRPIACFSHQANEATTPDGAWTEVDDQNGTGSARGFETQWDADGFQNASASWTTSAAWIGMAAEIKALVDEVPEIEYPQVDETYDEEHPNLFAGFVMWQMPADVIILDQIWAEMPIVDEAYDQEHDYSGFLQNPLADDNDVAVGLREIPTVDDGYDEEHDYSGFLNWQMPENVEDFQALPELPIVDETYDAEHDYAGFSTWQMPENVEDFQALAELPIVDETFDEEHDYAGFVTWQVAAADIQDFQPLAELPIVDETYDDEGYDYAGFATWQVPSDVTESLALPELAQVDESYDENAEQDFRGFTTWQMPENVEDFQALAELPQIDEHCDDAYEHDFNGFVFWIMPESVEDPLLGVVEFPQVDENYDLYAEFFGWQTVIVSETLEEPMVLAELPQIDLYYEPYFEYSGWQHFPIETAEVLFGGAVIRGNKHDQLIGKNGDQLVGVKKRQIGD